MKRKLVLLLCALFCGVALYAQQDDFTVTVAPYDDSYEDEICTIMDKNASFPGGVEALREYLKANVIYPTEAKARGVAGKVIVQFVVEKDGSISNVKVKRDIGFGCGEEVVRVVASMPKWTPALMKDRPVRTYFVLPVNFNGLAEDKEAKPFEEKE